ncbi:MAG: DUF1552 domain-containing protein [Myxococcales bacterium]|nr:DUF1552 domain-containing protein [Myxococcales bacterium]
MSWSKWRGGPTSRRAFLGGAAATLTLPWLASLRGARAGPSKPPVRLLFWFAPCGMVMDAWRPGGANGPLTELPPTLQPMKALTDDVRVLSGFYNGAADLPVVGHHARGTGSYLTCAPCRNQSVDDVRNGISIDQVVANAIGHHTLFESLELGTNAGSTVGACDSGWACAYTSNISWLDEDTPKPKLVDPAQVFVRLFGGFDPGLSADAAAQRRTWRTSVLDYVLEDARSLARELSISDQGKLEEYMTGVRALEQRIWAGHQGGGGAGPVQGSLDYPSTVRAMSDLTVLALEQDLTRVVTFMLENGASYRYFDWVGASRGHHDLSHHQGDPAYIEELKRVEQWEVAEFAYLVDRLKSATDPYGGGSLLDSMVAVFSSSMSDGNDHIHRDLPVMLAGSGGGAIAGGRHTTYADEQPVADLWMTLAGVAGVPLASFGLDGTTTLDLS